MSDALQSLTITVGSEQFAARLRPDLAPRACRQLLALLPYGGKLIHARWSGEAMWSPLGHVLPPDLALAPENARHEPHAGEVLLYAGEISEPELLITYGTSRFACRAGALRGNPVLNIDERLDRLAELGREVLWNGALPLCIEVPT